VSVSLVLTVIGPDRPGIVEALAEKAAAHGANWEESRMARLAGQFAGILRVSVAEDEADPLTEALAGLEREGLKVVVEKIAAVEADERARSLTLELVGNDRPGIVRQISHALTRRGVNVDELTTECTSAPMSGQTLFKVTARLRLPSGISVDDLQSSMERLAGDLMVDVTLDEVADGGAG
jgi:glycine cleavage system regulatory protein